MEYHQLIQNRTAQTLAVAKRFFRNLAVGGETTAALQTRAQTLDALAQARDDALADDDAAGNAEEQAFLTLQALTLSLPKSAEGELDATLPAEAALLDLLAPVYAIQPRSRERALERGRKLLSALTHIDAYLAGQTPARAPVRSAGHGADVLAAAMAALPALTQAVEDHAAAVRAARAALREAANELDQLNKRFYSKLRAEALTNGELRAALTQIDTGTSKLPPVLDIRRIVQGGLENRHVLVSYNAASYDAKLNNTLEWWVGERDAVAASSTPVDPAGNALGPFAIGATVRLRARTTHAGGTSLGSVRMLTLV